MGNYDLWDQRRYKNAITQAAQEAENWNTMERASYMQRVASNPGNGLIARPNYKTADDVMREKYGE